MVIKRKTSFWKNHAGICSPYINIQPYVWGPTASHSGHNHFCPQEPTDHGTASSPFFLQDEGWEGLGGQRGSEMVNSPVLVEVGKGGKKSNGISLCEGQTLPRQCVSNGLGESHQTET